MWDLGRLKFSRKIFGVYSMINRVKLGGGLRSLKKKSGGNKELIC